VILRRAACEFPNDNPELHDGIVWSCPEPRGRALPTLRLRETQGALPKVLGPAWQVEVPPSDERQPSPAAASSEPEPLAPSRPRELRKTQADLGDWRALPAPELPFERFVATVAMVAMNRGAVRAASAVTALLTLGRLGRDGVDSVLLEALARRRILDASGRVTPEFATTTQAWRSVLEGTGGDLAGCGSATLDAWAAELLAAVMNAPRGEVGELRRELRRSGVAAFGLLAVVA
jgi:hypothetical protein